IINYNKMEVSFMSVLSGLTPSNVFRYFEEICSIPHGSGNTLAISNYLADFAKEHSLRFIQDTNNNVIIYKEGTSGYEHSAPVMLQGHMDMVCEKDAGCQTDFTKDGLTLKLANGIISAEGTTLGGDDGIAVAYILAILDSSDIPHPPIEAIFTVDEEIGMLGAAALDCTPLTSHIMLNLDSEDEGHLLVSCAGGVTASCKLPVSYQTTSSIYHIVKLNVSGICGGHSGVEIIRQGANADKILGRILYDISKQLHINIINISGGNKDNAIPKEAQADIAIYSPDDLDRFIGLLQKEKEILSHEYTSSDPDIHISYEVISDIANNKADIMTDDSTTKVITALILLPNGIQKMSHDIEGLVQTSLNLGIMRTEKSFQNSHVIFSFSVRSSVKTEKEYLVNQLECLMSSLGGTIDLNGEYPAWEYKKDSPLRSLMIEIFNKQYGHEPVIEALHAGVECGIFNEKIPDFDCVSFGPDIKDIHTTNECMSVDSIVRTWNYLLEILKRLK
ncbi:MAG: aminoacyl-histidine dipeptidase, partial [Coprococcus sp.]